MLGGIAKDEDGNLTEQWDPFLPRPPSMRKIDDGEDRSNAEQVAVFGANTQEGSTLVRMLSDKGLRVVAAVRVFGSKKTKQLISLKGVTVKQADTSDRDSLLNALKDCSRAFAVTRYWEKFESRIEEKMAMDILNACSSVSPPVKAFVLATFEDIASLKLKGRKSQIVPTRDGRIFPEFAGKNKLDSKGKEMGVAVTHMMTSYSDDDDNKKSLILLKGHSRRIVVNSFIQDEKK
jgi:NAD(P)-dependent dehydrogenase (short-subunit alcohol dehydrogenase family)